MNFLAHFTLAYPDEELVVGNYLADLVKNRGLELYAPGIVRGIRLHRAIDHYTDNHAAVRALCARWRERHGKYAPVVVDLLFDYALTAEWEDFGPLPLPAFQTAIYAILRRYLPAMPAKTADLAERMMADDWLQHYTSATGLASVAVRLQRRVSRPDLLGDMVKTLREEEAPLREAFRMFFPDIKGYVEDWKRNAVEM